MDARFPRVRAMAATALALASALLAGCATTDVGHALMTANEAVERALAAAPGAVLVGVYGSEGAPLEVPEPAGERLVFADDGQDDGPLGDGRTSSWVVSYLLGDRWVHRRVSADGTLGEPTEQDLPEFMVSQRVLRDTAPRVDSPDVAKVARVDNCTRERPATPGFLYSYSLYNESPIRGHAHRDDPLDEPSVPFARFGLSEAPRTWVAVVVDMAPGSRHDAATLRLDALGAPLACEVGRPLQRILRYDFDSYRDGGDGDLGVPIPWSDSFHVGHRVEHVRAYLMVQGGGLTDDANALLRMGDGSVLADGNAWRMKALDVKVPAAGTWTLDVTPPKPEPALGADELPLPAQEAYIHLVVHSYEGLGP